MSAEVISSKTFIGRVGEPDERPRDRFFAHRMLEWGYRQRWRQAVEEGDYEAMEVIDRNWQQLECL